MVCFRHDFDQLLLRLIALLDSEIEWCVLYTRIYVDKLLSCI